jgi:CHASE2 domain-containing sensor protein/serine phosphatase RsbU (regulator of sigma subunit)
MQLYDDIGSGYAPYRLLTSGQGRPLAVVVALLIAAGHVGWGERLWQPARHAVFDAYQRAFPRQVRAHPSVIVAIDDASLAALGQWPWPRTRLARLIDRVQQLGAVVVGLDMVMPEADRLSPDVFITERADLSPVLREELARVPSNDTILADTLRQVPAVIGRAGVPTPQESHLSLPGQTAVRVHGEVRMAQLQAYPGHLVSVSPIEAAASGRGYLNTTADMDGVVRTAPLLVQVNGELAPTFALELLRVAVGAEWYSVHGDSQGVRGVQISNAFLPTDPDGRIRLYYSPRDPRRQVSALAVLNGTVDASLLANHIAIIGVTSVGISDIVATPVAASMYGVEVQAQLIENVLADTRLMRPSIAPWMEVGVFLVLAAVLIALMPRVRPVVSIGLLLGTVAVFIASSLIGFRHARLLFDPSLPTAGNGLLLVVLLTAGFAAAERNRREIKAALDAERLETARMAGELRAAHDIQMGMVPPPGAIEGLPDSIDFHALLKPAEAVGGDLYDAFMLDPHHFCFLIGDVTGKGVPAALFMAVSKTLYKSAALRTHMPLHELMRLVNAEISRENPAHLFVTAMAGVLDTRTGVLEWCCAGHEAPILLRQGAAPCMLDTPGGPPLCVLEDFPYATDRLQLQAEDVLIIITDGVTEAQNLDQTLYGWERLLATLHVLRQGATDTLPAAAVCQELYADVRRFMNDAAASDDVTIVAIRFAGPAPAASTVTLP